MGYYDTRNLDDYFKSSPNAASASDSMPTETKEKEPGIVGKSLGGVLKVIDQIERPYYALMNVGKDIMDKGEFHPLKSAYEGISLKKKTEFSDVLGAAGWNPSTMVGKAGKFAVSFIGGVALDPATYLSFGTSAGLRIGRLGKVLSKPGEKMFLKELSKTSGVALNKVDDIAKAGLKVSDDAYETAVRNTMKKALMEEGGQDIYFNKTVMKYAGREMPGTSDFLRGIPRTVSKNLEPLMKKGTGRTIKLAGKYVKESLGYLFDPAYGIKNSTHFNAWEKYKLLEQLEKVRVAKSYQQAKNIEEARNVFKGLNTAQRKQVTDEVEKFLPEKNLTNRKLGDIRDPKIRDAVKTMQNKMEEFKNAEIASGVRKTSETLDDGYIWRKIVKGTRPEDVNTGIKGARKFGSNTVAEQRELWEEGAKGGEFMFEEDAARILAGRGNKSISTILTKQMDDWLIGEGFVRKMADEEKTNMIDKGAEIKSGTDLLAQEARSAEEFVKAQGTLVYRGGDTAIDVSRGSGKGISVSDKETAGLFTPPKGGLVDEAILPKTARILKEGDIPKNLQDDYIEEAKVLADPNNFSTTLQKSVIEKQQAIIEYARKNGFDAVEFPFEKEIRVVKPNVLKTKSQLIDIWNEANKATPKKTNMIRLATKPGYAAHQELAREIERIIPQMKDIGSKRFIDLFDSVQNTWKLSVTSLWASFHARNAYSNFFLNWLGGNESLTTYKDAGKLWWYGHDFKKGKEVSKFGDDLINLAGRDYKISELYNIMAENEVIGLGQVGADVMPKLGLNAKDRDWWFRAPRRVGTAVENNGRMALFMDRLNKGDDIASAKMHVNKFLFDYSDLTDFERNVMKRVIPFYTWMRKNMPLQLEQLAKQPGKYTAITHLQKGAETMTPAMEEKFLPPWMKEEEMFIRVADKLYYNPDLPFQDLARITLSDRTFRELAGSSTPMVKALFEIVANKDFFRNKPLADQNLPSSIFVREKIKQEIINNMRFNTLYKKATDTEKGWFSRGLDLVFGIKLSVFDIAESKKYNREKLEKSALKRREKAKIKAKREKSKKQGLFSSI